MKPGVSFDDLHSLYDFGLVLADAVIPAPEVQTNYITVPGRSGLLDATTALTGEVTYKNRLISLSFETAPTVTRRPWPELLSEVSNHLHGQRVRLTFDDDPDYYYLGRITVGDLKREGAKVTLPITANCDPYKYYAIETRKSATLTTTDTALTLDCERRPVVPAITVSTETVLSWGGISYTVSAGGHRIPNIRLTRGSHTLKARTTEGVGTITITYQEGSL